MRPGGNLFLKIFTAFWLLTMAVLASWMLSSDYFDSRPPGPSALAPTPLPPPHGRDRDGPPPHLSGRDGAQAPPHRVMLRLIYDLQNLESEELEALIRQAPAKYDMQIFLLRPSGEDLLGRKVPKEVSNIADKLRGRRRRARDISPEASLSAHTIYNPDHGPLRAVFLMNRGARPIINLLGGNPWLRLLLAVLISGLVCYGLSRLLTSRIKELQRASRQLAEGDLSARITVRERGGDETDELARDFNSMAEQLEERISAQKRLLSDVSHELRSPLARLRIALALAEQEHTANNVNLQRIEREAQRLEELIGQLLSSRPQDVPMDTHIDLVSLLEKLCEDASFEGRPQGKSATLAANVPEQVIATHGDLLLKAFENILRNALAHTVPGSNIEVNLQATNQQCSIAIADHGPGIPEAELEKVFGEFYRVDTARSRDSGGHGLGLAIARRAVLQHGGTITAQNVSSGLVITVILPVH